MDNNALIGSSIACIHALYMLDCFSNRWVLSSSDKIQVGIMLFITATAKHFLVEQKYSISHQATHHTHYPIPK